MSELSGSGETFEPKTKLTFNSGDHVVPAYLPCEGESGCSVKKSGQNLILASLKAFIAKEAKGVLQNNAPTSQSVLPLRITVRAYRQTGGAREIQVGWAATGVSFIAFFPGAKLDKGQLRQLIDPKIGKLEFDTFPAFKNHPDLLLAGSAPAAVIVRPDDKVEVGDLVFKISEKFPPARKLVLLAVDQATGEPVARLGVPLP